MFDENLAGFDEKRIVSKPAAAVSSPTVFAFFPSYAFSLSLSLERNSHISNSRSNISYNASISDAYNSHSYANAVFSPGHCRVPRFMPVKAARCPVTHTRIRGVCFEPNVPKDSFVTGEGKRCCESCSTRETKDGEIRWSNVSIGSEEKD